MAAFNSAFDPWNLLHFHDALIFFQSDLDANREVPQGVGIVFPEDLRW